MMDIRFIHDGMFADECTVRQWFFESANDAGVDREFAEYVWEDAKAGDPNSRELVEETTGVEIMPWPPKLSA